MIKGICILAFLFQLAITGYCQKKTNSGEKAPTRKEMEAMMKQANEMLSEAMKEMSPEERKAMDSLGISLPDLKKAPAVGDAALSTAWEEEGRIVPKKNAAKIAAIPAPLAEASIPAYVKKTNTKIFPALNNSGKMLAERLYGQMKSERNKNDDWGNAAAGLWMMGYPELAFYIAGKVCEEDISNTNNLSNYTAMLTMLGAPHLSIPLLNKLNMRYRKNSTILNNLGQAWLHLGETGKAEKYLDSVISIYPTHSQATYSLSLIEESRGNKSAAVSLMKKSIREAYTKDKEERLRKLGIKLSQDDIHIPGTRKPDPLNLGSFEPPPFPVSVMECVSLGQAWNEFRNLINAKISDLQRRAKDAEKLNQSAMEQRMKTDIALVNTAIRNPGTNGQFVSVPMYADRAAKKLQPAIDIYSVKLEQLLKKFASWATTEMESARQVYETEMVKLRRENLEQTGEGKPNKDFCPRFREAADKYLKTVNPVIETHYKELLQLQKVFYNENAWWGLYMYWPETFDLLKIQWQIAWLNDLKGATTASFVSITDFVCETPRSPKKIQLQKFDDVACKYHHVLKLPFGKIVSNCSKTYGEFKAEFLAYKIEMDADKQGGFREQFVRGSFEIGVKTDKSIELGPLSAGVSAGATIGVEMDRNGITDFIAGVNVEGTAEIKTNPIGGAGEGPSSDTSAGMEAKISLVSGSATVGGSGIFDKIK